MDAIQRLARAGMDVASAVENVVWFRQQGDDEKLELYVREIEERQRHGVCVV